MLKNFFIFFFPALLLINQSCSEIVLKESENTPDVIPPKILDIRITGPETLVFDFSANIKPLSKVFTVSPDIGISHLESENCSLNIVFNDEQIPGTEYYIKGAVKDRNGNTLTFLAEFYGFNPDIPPIILNEVTTQGSTAHPDMVELYIKGDGNMAGVAFFEGTAEDYEAKFIFPPIIVTSGDYIIIHTKPEGIPDEINETLDKSESGGIDSNHDAWDIWPVGFSGLSGNNGVLSIYTRPGGNLLDVFLYSNRTSLSDEKYRGFGSLSTMMRVDYIAEKGAWIFEGEQIAPEDCVNPDPSTATRSICRDSSSADTDGKGDWHTVPTSGYSFGSVNTDDVYVP